MILQFSTISYMNSERPAVSKYGSRNYGRQFYVTLQNANVWNQNYINILIEFGRIACKTASHPLPMCVIEILKTFTFYRLGILMLYPAEYRQLSYTNEIPRWAPFTFMTYKISPVQRRGEILPPVSNCHENSVCISGISHEKMSLMSIRFYLKM
jgi:hypothetical protein